MRILPSLALLAACDGAAPDAGAVSVPASGGDLRSIMAARGLTEADVGTWVATTLGPGGTLAYGLLWPVAVAAVALGAARARFRRGDLL